MLSQVELTYFRRTLILWGHKNFRDFPWRKSEDPYLLLSAEVMLHRTQASQVVPVYEKYIRAYPRLSDLCWGRHTKSSRATLSFGPALEDR